MIYKKKNSSSHTQIIGTDPGNSWSVIVERICTSFIPDEREDAVAHELDGTFPLRRSDLNPGEAYWIYRFINSVRNTKWAVQVAIKHKSCLTVTALIEAFPFAQLM